MNIPLSHQWHFMLPSAITDSMALYLWIGVLLTVCVVPFLEKRADFFEKNGKNIAMHGLFHYLC